MNYSYVPQSFSDLMFWKDNKEGTLLKIISNDVYKYSAIHRCSVYVDLIAHYIRYEISRSEHPKVVNIANNEFKGYVSEKEALRWLFDELEEFYSKTKISFYFGTALYHQIYCHEDARAMICNFLRSYHKSCKRDDLKKEVQNILSLSSKTGPKEFSERMLRRAPMLSSVIVDFLQRRESYYQTAVLSYLAEHKGEKND